MICFWQIVGSVGLMHVFDSWRMNSFWHEKKPIKKLATQVKVHTPFPLGLLSTTIIALSGKASTLINVLLMSTLNTKMSELEKYQLCMLPTGRVSCWLTKLANRVKVKGYSTHNYENLVWSCICLSVSIINLSEK